MKPHTPESVLEEFEPKHRQDIIQEMFRNTKAPTEQIREAYAEGAAKMLHFGCSPQTTFNVLYLFHNLYTSFLREKLQQAHTEGERVGAESENADCRKTIRYLPFNSAGQNHNPAYVRGYSDARNDFYAALKARTNTPTT